MTSLDILRESLDGVRSLIGLEESFEDPPGPEHRLAAFALRGACTVLTVASLEAFLRNLFEEQLDRLGRQNVPLAHFPQRLRAEAIYASLELAMKGDHETRGSSKVDRLPKISSVARIVAADSFWPKALADTQSNPDANCVKRMFRAVDCSSDVFGLVLSTFEEAWGSPVAKTFPATKLDAIVQSRHRVAHTADAAHVSRRELNDNVHFVSVLCEVLHQTLKGHMDGLILEARRDFLAVEDV
jgi:hypothetical protein